MISITNEAAAQEATRLARDLFEIALRRFAQLPAGVDLRRLVADVGLELHEAGADSPTFKWNSPHETVAVRIEAGETAGAVHTQAVTELTRTRTAVLDGELAADAVAQIREGIRSELASARDRIARPLRLGWLPGANERRRLQHEGLITSALATLNGVPLSVPSFDEVLASIRRLVGGVDGFPDVEALRQEALAHHRDFQIRRETVLMLAWEAIASDDDGAVLELARRREHFAHAKETARAIEAKERAARIAAVEAKKQEEMRRKRVQIARELEERRKWDEMTRPTWNPDQPDRETGPELGI